jgi:hypothetical protein
MPTRKLCQSLLPLVLAAASAALAQESGRLARDHAPGVTDPNTLPQIQVSAIEADFVGIVTIQKISSSPGCWSTGDRQCTQEVELRVETPWKGDLPRDTELKVEFPLLEGSPTASRDGPFLSPGLFERGTRRIVFLQRREAQWTGLDAEFGALFLERSEEVRQALGL